MQKKIASKISAGVLSALLVLQGMFPTVSVMADEISETKPSETVIEKTITESSEETKASEETTVPETSETTTETKTSETEETTASEETTVPETSETGITETSETTETTETAAPSEPTEARSTVNIVNATDSKAFSDIVSDLSSANRLIVQTTSDIRNVIKNATGVSFDGTYVISFSDKESYNSAITYFEAHKITYAEDGAVKLCADRIELILNSGINPNAKTRIAVIDTGSNVANEKYSVIGDDVADQHGHGTNIANYILSETDDAYIISIKAIGADGTGNVSDICAAVTMAQSMNVDVILMALSVRDNGEYDAFKELVKEAKASGITVIASAGNNNADASAYLPAGIEGVITVGAITADGFKYSSSNYGSCVNYYVPATSTSQASALFAGKFIAKNIGDVATSCTIAPDDPTDTDDSDTDLAEVNLTKKKAGVYIFVTKEQMIAAGYTSSDAFRNAVVNAADAMTGAKYAQSGSGGSGEKVDCITYTHLAYAQALKKISKLRESGGYVYFSGSCKGEKPWRLYTTTGSTGCTSWLSLHGIGSPSSAGVKMSTHSLSDLGVKKGDLVFFGKSSDGYWHHAAIYAGSSTYFWQARGSAYTAGKSKKSGVTVNEDSSGNDRILVLHIEDFVEESSVTVTKSVTDGYSVLTNSNSCYSLNGTTYTLYSAYSESEGLSGSLATFSIDASGKTSTKYKIKANTTYYLKETAAGSGFELDNDIYKIVTGSSITADITVTNLSTGDSNKISVKSNVFTIPMTDTPVVDPFSFNLDKVSTEGQHTTADFNNAKFRLEFYGQSIAFDTAVSGTPTTVFEFALNGKTQRVSLEYLAGLTAIGGSNKTYFKDLYDSEILDNDFMLPLGTYRIYEISAPAGYELNTQVFRVRIYQGSDGNASRTFGVEGAASSGYNYFSHKLDKSGSDYDLLKIALDETTINGYYSLTKEMDDNEIVKDIDGIYTFELRNTTDNALIATGVSEKDGRVRWRYTLEGLRMADNLGIILTDTPTYELELAVYNAGKTKISYEVREFIPKTVFGNTSIEYSYTTPSGWTRSADGKYFSKKVTLNDNATFVDVIKNNVEYGDITINKAIPVDDTFDRTKVTFYLYNTDKNVLVTSGKVDSKGNIEWTKLASTGYGVDDCRVGINEVKHLPLGNYRIEEVWNRAYLESLDGKKVEIISTNNSGWALDQKADTTRYYKAFVLKEDGKVFAFGDITNDEHVQWFNMTKTVTVAGDVSTIKADLFYVTDNKELIRVAEGSCTTSKGKGTYNFTWEYNGVSENRNGLQTLKLPEGDYIVKEYVPKTFYANGKSNVPYTYMVPEGFTAVKDKSGKIVSFEKSFHASNNETAVISQSITNTRIEASLEIRKVEQAATIDRDFKFAIYYRGNDAEAKNIGVFTDKYLLDTVTVRTSKGSGMASLSKIPEGWYEIVEIQSAGWAASWVNSDSNTADGKLVHASSEDGTNATPVIRDNVALFGVDVPGVLVYNKISIDVFVKKYDAWTKKVITTAGNHPEDIHLTFYLYKDTNGNGALDKDEMGSYQVMVDTDDDGNVVFKDIPAGKYILREVATVNGYYLTAPDIAFEVNDAINFEAHPANTPYAEPVKVTKVDNETNEPLSGAEFAVFVDSNDNGVWDKDDKKAEVWIDANKNKLIDDGELKECAMAETSKGVYESYGVLHFNDGSKEFGNRYFIVEVKAPAGYFFVKPDGTFTTENTCEAFTIRGKDTTATDFKVGIKEFKFRNQTGTVYVHKANDKNEFLSGAEFTIYKDEECKVVVGKLTENTEKQRYEYRGLDIGKYYIKETIAPEYYIEDPNTYAFEITTSATHATVDNIDWKPEDGIRGEFLNFNPIVKTTLTDTETKTHIVALRKTITLVDTVKFEGLTVGKSYVMEGTLYDKATGEIINDSEGKPITNSVIFVPETTDGTVDVPFTVEIELVTGKTLVAAEKVKPENSERYCGIHYDLNDVEQTVYVPKIGTTATIGGNKAIYLGSKEVRNITITDKLSYKGLEPGRTYRAEAALYKTDGTQITRNGTPVIAMLEFTPKSSEGSVEVKITFSSEGLSEGDKIVVFEKVFDVETGILIGSHEDLNDDGQTVTIHFRPSTGEVMPTYMKFGAALLSLSTLVASLLIRRKKKLSC